MVHNKCINFNFIIFNILIFILAHWFLATCALLCPVCLQGDCCDYYYVLLLIPGKIHNVFSRYIRIPSNLAYFPSNFIKINIFNLNFNNSLFFTWIFHFITWKQRKNIENTFLNLGSTSILFFLSIGKIILTFHVFRN